MGLSRIILKATRKFGDKVFYPVAIGFVTNYLFEKYIVKKPLLSVEEPLTLPATQVQIKVLEDQIKELKNDKLQTDSVNKILTDQNDALKELNSCLKDKNEKLTLFVKNYQENTLQFKLESLFSNYNEFAFSILKSAPARFTDLSMSSFQTANTNILFNPDYFDAVCKLLGLS